MAMNHARPVPQHTLVVKNLMPSIDHMDEDYLHSVFYQVLTEYQGCIERAYFRVKIMLLQKVVAKSKPCGESFHVVGD